MGGTRPLTRRPVAGTHTRRTHGRPPAARRRLPPVASVDAEEGAQLVFRPARCPQASFSEFQKAPGKDGRGKEGESRRGSRSRRPRPSQAQPLRPRSLCLHGDGRRLLPDGWPHSCSAERWPTAGTACGARARGQARQNSCCHPLALPSPCSWGQGSQTRVQDAGSWARKSLMVTSGRGHWLWLWGEGP